MTIRERYQYYLRKIVTWAEGEMDANPYLSLKTKERIKKI